MIRDKLKTRMFSKTLTSFLWAIGKSKSKSNYGREFKCNLDSN